MIQKKPKLTMIDMSASGMSVEPGHTVPWRDPSWETCFRYMSSCGAFIAGGSTYEWVLKGHVGHLCGAVLSHRLHASEGDTHFFTRPDSIASFFQEQRYQHVVLIGGGTAGEAFLSRGLVDKVVYDSGPMGLRHGGNALFSDVLLERANPRPFVDKKTLGDGSGCVRHSFWVPTAAYVPAPI